MSTPRSLKTRLILRSLFAVIFVAVFLFLPAGSFRFWQGWVFMAILFVPTPVTSVYFLKRDPQLVERRLRTEEKITQQKTIIRWAQWVVFGSLLIPGLDHRLGHEGKQFRLSHRPSRRRAESHLHRTLSPRPPSHVLRRCSHAALHAARAWLLVGAAGLPPRHPFDRPPPPQRGKNALPRPPRLFRLLPPHPLPPPPPPLVSRTARQLLAY